MTARSTSTPSFIAIPGRSKSVDTDQIQVIWGEARDQLKKATEVVIIGYALPASDAKARRFLLGALQGNHQHTLSVTIVLGGDSSAQDRWASMLRQTLDRTERGQGPGKKLLLRQPPIYAQDFIQGFALDPTGHGRL